MTLKLVPSLLARAQQDERAAHDPVHVAVRHRARGHCELCSALAPFVADDGSPYLELHHITPRAEGGAHDLANTVALCPNCHRAVHHGRYREGLRSRLCALAERGGASQP